MKKLLIALFFTLCHNMVDASDSLLYKKLNSSGIALQKSATKMMDAIVYTTMGSVCILVAPLAATRDQYGDVTSEGMRPLLYAAGGAFTLIGIVSTFQSIKYLKLAGKRLTLNASPTSVGLKMTF